MLSLPQPPDPPYAPPAPVPYPTYLVATFTDDVAFLSKFGPVHVLESPGGGRVAVSAKYQGRVMTSAVEPSARSLGFIHRKFIEEGRTGTPFDNYGGEDRFWLGPEAGQYGLYFPKGKPFVFANWQTPHELQEGEWDTKDAGPSAITFKKRMKVVNHAGTQFDVDVLRKVSVLSASDVETRLGFPIPEDLKWVAFSTTNTITNRGRKAWTRDRGLLSVWILGMFAPVRDTEVVIPYDKNGPGEIVNAGYFGDIPADRLTVTAGEKDGLIFFGCDGRYRSKIGVGPSRAKPVLGSYSTEGQLLTLVMYNGPVRSSRYVNSMWEMQKDPYAGDVVNSYNDGPTEPGKPALGGFYEIETSSPAAALASGAKLVHVHETLHFAAGKGIQGLNTIASKVLGLGGHPFEYPEALTIPAAH